jgi:hypothetical protein
MVRVHYAPLDISQVRGHVTFSEVTRSGETALSNNPEVSGSNLAQQREFPLVVGLSNVSP